MPRRRPARPGDDEDREESLTRLSNSLIGPHGAQAEGYVVRNSSGDKSYRCPFCQGLIQPKVPHIVAYPEDRLDDRRHYHSACWSRYRKGLGSR